MRTHRPWLTSPFVAVHAPKPRPMARPSFWRVVIRPLWYAFPLWRARGQVADLAAQLHRQQRRARLHEQALAEVGADYAGLLRWQEEGRAIESAAELVRARLARMERRVRRLERESR